VVRATGGGTDVSGRAIGVASDGALRIQTADGDVVTVHAGDVSLLSSAE
jgi:biotin-(acetyl-CoA carboxylase) ligase